MKINVDSSQELSFDWSTFIEYVIVCVLSRFHKLQQEEEEVIRKRAANSTALAAIGPRKKRKLDEALEGSSTSAAVSKTSIFTIKDVQQILLIINSHFFKTSFANFTKHQRQHLLVDDFFFPIAVVKWIPLKSYMLSGNIRKNTTKRQTKSTYWKLNPINLRRV